MILRYIPKSFVFEVMEINEEIEEADSVDELRSIFDENYDEMQILVENGQKLLDNEQYDDFGVLLNKIKYRERIQLNAGDKLEELGFFYTR